MTLASPTPMRTIQPDAVLEVPREDEASYRRRSYNDLLRAWDDLVARLQDAVRVGDRQVAACVEEELRRFWPRPREVANAHWIAETDRQHPLGAAQLD
jgi:hypothetical protein